MRNFKEFMDTRPPIFKEAAEPLEVDEWINTMEQKFWVLRLTEELKTEYASHQLQGPIGIWWSHHHTTFLANTPITWEMFTTAFHGNYILPGLMAMKVGEFMRLTQGIRTMKEYLYDFNNLSRYALEFINTDAKKIASFKRGLNPKKLKTMGTSSQTVFNEFISDCLNQENNNNAYSAFKSRKRAFESGPSQARTSMASHPPYRSLAPGARFRPPQKRNQNMPPQQRNHKPFKMTVSQAKTGQGSSSRAVTLVRGPCYNYNQSGHFAKFCPYPKKPQNQYQARVHHITIDDIPKGEPMTASMFSINNQPVVVLFDSRSSHSFISQAFAKRHEQKIVELECAYRISSARADLLTNQIVRVVTLNIADRQYKLNLIVMPRLVLDVIMGMNWMNKMGVVIDVGSRTISLKEPVGEGTFQVVLPRRIDFESTTYAVQTTLLANIPIVCEFSDVFLDELPGLPSDRDVEFAIELIPRTPPILKRPYRMPPNELTKLKKQFQDLLTKGLICPSSSKRGCPALLVKK
jgi:hypothetical protein